MVVTGTIKLRVDSHNTVSGASSSRQKECTSWSEGSGSSETTYTGRYQTTLDSITLQNYIAENPLKEGVYEYPFTLP
jgi:hypothetical protein